MTASSFRMAVKFAAFGWRDITVAFPVNINEIGRINWLAKETNLHVVVENPEAINYLENNLAAPVSAFIKIDSGSGRTGIPLDQAAEVDQLVKEIENASKLKLKGFLAHDGHTYRERNPQAIIDIHKHSVEGLNALRDRYIGTHPDLILSIGDTPACSVLERFEGIDEIRAGNFMYYDVMQEQIGACTEAEIGVAVACPVVAIHPRRNQAVVYGRCGTL